MKIFKALIACIMVLAGTALLAPSASAHGTGMQGCTPGYWKTHTDNWQEATPTTTLGVLFSRPNLVLDDDPVVVSSITALEALQGNGKNPLPNGYAQLARAATAAWLNAAHDDMGSPWQRYDEGLDGRPALVRTVIQAFNAGDLASMNALASRLDADNNLGCPLN